jgi:tRNA(Ile)-lysidine synthetase-like protein
MDENINLVIEKLKQTLKLQKVLLAFSTGVDSMVLLDLLRKSLDASQIVIAHVNHQRRSESAIEETYILSYAKKNHINCYTTKLPHYSGNNFQNWARKKRYAFFLEIAEAEKIDIVLLAHHADDNLETILLRLLRSSSLEGYGGIKEYSNYQGLTIYRPLLNISKDEIIEYAKSNSIKYFEDSSNFEDDYARNRIRHYVLPILKKENSALTKAISCFSNTILEANEFIKNYETNFIKRQQMVYNNNDYFAKIDLGEFLNETTFLQTQILFRMLKPFSLSKECILDTIKQLKSSKQNIVQNINPHLMMIKEYGYVIFTNQKIKDYYLKIDEEGEYELDNHTYLHITKNICNFITSSGKLWYNINMLPIIIRTRKNGDKIKTKKGSISVSDYLTNHKIPYLQRKQILLLCDKDDLPIAILGYIIK